MNRTELDFAIELAASEGWNPGLHDADCFYAADNGGFFMGMLGDEPIACLSAVKYSDSFGFIGLYIVREPYRGKGYGIKLLGAGMDYLKGCNIGLDGVVTQQSNYRKSGFQPAHRNIRYKGRTGGQFPNESGLIELADIPFTEINRYDSAFFPADRTAFLKLWISQPCGAALGIVQSGQLVAYGVIRVCLEGYKIAPLFANNPELAETLFLGLNAKVKTGLPVFLDVPEKNPNALALAQRFEMQAVFETARMYTKQIPNLDYERLYGITSFELG